MSNIARYTNGHLFSLYGKASERTPLTEQLAQVLGAVNEQDFANFDKFAERSGRLGKLAQDRNCKLIVDAE